MLSCCHRTPVDFHVLCYFFVAVGNQEGSHVLSGPSEERLWCSLQWWRCHCVSCRQLQQIAGEPEGKWSCGWLIKKRLASNIFLYDTCLFQVRNGTTGSVLFQSEEKSSRIRCTCICRQSSAVVVGQEDGTVQVNNMHLRVWVVLPMLMWILAAVLLCFIIITNCKMSLNVPFGKTYLIIERIMHQAMNLSDV